MGLSFIYESKLFWVGAIAQGNPLTLIGHPTE